MTTGSHQAEGALSQPSPPSSLHGDSSLRGDSSPPGDPSPQADTRGSALEAAALDPRVTQPPLPPVVRLGHDLVRQFAHLDAAQAAQQIATHITKFWDPRMQDELLADVRLGDPTLHPLLVLAAEHLVHGAPDDARIAQPSG